MVVFVVGLIHAENVALVVQPARLPFARATYCTAGAVEGLFVSITPVPNGLATQVAPPCRVPVRA